MLRFATLLSVALSGVMLLAAVTPLSHWWFGRASALAPPLAALATAAFWLMIPAPALSVWQSWYQGALVHAHRTRAITESMLVLLVATAAVLAAGVAAPRAPGLFFAAAGLVLGGAAQIVWLRLRARAPLAGVVARDAPGAVAGAAALGG